MSLNNSQYDIIMRDYEQKQLRSRSRLNQHYEEAYSKIPRLQDIDNTISSLSVSQVKKLLDGDSQAVASAKLQVENLRLERSVLLKEHGYPDHYLEESYHCPDCKDTGYIAGQKCHCFKKAIIDLLYAQSNVKEILKKENFNTFQLSYYSNNRKDPTTGRSSREVMTTALDTCHRYVDTFSTDISQNLFLYGDTGVGKTFLSHCITKELIDHTFSVIYFTATELFDVMAKSRFDHEIESRDMDEYILDCDLLIIDDLGTELTNSFVVSQLFVCINERFLRKKSTIISTNLSLETIVENYSERILSRITSNYTMLKLTGDDIRIKKKLMNLED